MTRESELRAQIAALQEELEPLEDARRTAEAATFIGRYFKYGNSYGSGDRWWLYLKVTSAGDSWPSGITFQAMSDGAWEVREDRHVSGLGEGGNWIEITADEYEKAWQEFIQDVVRLGRITQGVA